MAKYNKTRHVEAIARLLRRRIPQVSVIGRNPASLKLLVRRTYDDHGYAVQDAAKIARFIRYSFPMVQVVHHQVSQESDGRWRAEIVTRWPENWPRKSPYTNNHSLGVR